jgi:4-hydroxy-tetrahydrodipicolinate synthase
MPPHITPFDINGEIDEPALRKLVHFWIDEGASGLVPCGSNGEAPYMTREERKKVIEIVVDEANRKVPVIAGTGAPSTRETVNLTRDAKDVGADAALIVTPYYYTPNDEELFDHFKTILESVDLPIILYNVPKFTGYNLNINVVRRLVREYSQIVGIKDSSGLVGRISELVSYVGDKISVLGGTGDMILPCLEMGGSGGIVAIANVAPKLCSDIYNAFKSEDHDEARRLQIRGVHLNELLVKKFNQISSIKEALMQLGQPAGFPRRPSLPLKQEAREEIKNSLFKYI